MAWQSPLLEACHLRYSFPGRYTSARRRSAAYADPRVASRTACRHLPAARQFAQRVGRHVGRLERLGGVLQTALYFPQPPQAREVRRLEGRQDLRSGQRLPTIGARALPPTRSAARATRGPADGRSATACARNSRAMKRSISSMTAVVRSMEAPAGNSYSAVKIARSDGASCVLVDEQPELGAAMRVPGGVPRLMRGVGAPLCALVA